MQPGENFKTYLPKDPGLQGLVAYYYLHYSDEPNFESRFEYYPHYRNGLTVYLDKEVAFNDHFSRVNGALTTSFIALYARSYGHRIQVHISGPFRKMGIAFEPLGLHHFIDSPLSVVCPDTVSLFPCFNKDLEAVARQVYFDPEADPVPLMDSLLVSQRTHFEEPILHQAVRILMSSGGAASVEELASTLCVSRKTLLRKFRKHLCCSVEDFKKLVRFRNALNDYRDNSAKTTFTALSHKHLYYDQPAFINHFKSITGLRPRAFFKELQQYGVQDTYWLPRKL